MHSAKAMREAVNEDKRWVSVAFTWNGLRTLGVDDTSLGTFPEEFRQGMVARAEVLGDTGANRPENWVDNMASPDLHAIVILFARDAAERARCQSEHEKLVRRCEGVAVLSSLDLETVPPFGYPHDHFGYRDRLSDLVIEGSGEEPKPGFGGTVKAGEFILGYPDEEGIIPPSPQPEILSRNGSYMAYRRMQEHVGAFRDFLRQHGETPEEQELVAAKLMGRWRSGAPLVLAPNRDDPELGADMQRTNDFNYKEMDPHGYAVPLGAHIRRMNPRDTAANMNRRRMIRRGAPYGPHLREGAPEDGKERGIAAFVICASLIRQFEFAQNVWINDKNFHELGNERDPIIGNQDGTLEFKIPQRPIRKKISGLPAFTTVRGGAYFFLPGLKGLRYLASLGGAQ
ncbi:MAG: peroxidase [Verrucomicrobia bacterium]|nr:MAG: peroxidase [Verrucomicrobiota bacterium]